MPPQRQPKINIEGLHVVEDVDARGEQAPINEHTVTFRIVDALSSNIGVNNFVLEYNHAISFPFLEPASSSVDTSVPQYQRSDRCSSFVSHALQHGRQPILVHNGIVLENHAQPFLSLSYRHVPGFALHQPTVHEHEAHVVFLPLELTKVLLGRVIKGSGHDDDAKRGVGVFVERLKAAGKDANPVPWHYHNCDALKWCVFIHRA